MGYRYMIIGIVLAAAMIYAAIRVYTCHFECPNCDNRFRVGFIEFLSMSGVLLGKYKRASLFGDFDVTCPKCGARNRLPLKRGKQ